MSKALQEIFGYVTITDAIKDTSEGIPNPLPGGFMTVSREVVANKAKFARTKGERRTARQSPYGAPPRRFDLREVGETPVILLHFTDEIYFDPFTYQALRNKESYEHDQSLELVKEFIDQCATRYQNTRIAVIFRLLRSGLVHFDGDGNLLPSSSGATYTSDINMNANNQNQLNGLITASWALNNTNIPLQIRNWKKRALRLTGYPIDNFLYGENIPDYLRQNDYVKEEFIRYPRVNQSALDDNELADGFLGIKKWTPVYQGFYEDADGTNQDLWGADDVIACPEPASFWYQLLLGSMPVPTNLNIQNDGMAAMNSMKTVHGMGGYGYVSHRPMGVIQNSFDTFFPAVKNPDVLYQADVTP